VSEDKELLIQRVLQAQRSFQRLITSTAGIPLLRLNLTMQQLRVLLVLDFYGSQSSHNLTDNLGVSAATVTGIIDRLVAQDLVRRREDANDRRIRRIELTGRGRDLLHRLEESRDTFATKILRGLEPDELTALDQLMRKLHRLAEQSTHDSAGVRTTTTSPARAD
jgi:DNA-binding MarR family transcriptional regulator